MPPNRPAPNAEPAAGVAAGAPTAAALKVRLAFAALLLCTALLHLGLARLAGPLGAPADRPLSGDEKRYVEVATAWAVGEPAELDPLWPPGYPAVVALILRCGGSLAGVVGLQVAALFVAGLALARIALVLGASPAGAAAAASLLVLDPEIAGFAWLFRPEALHLALFLVALLLVLPAPRFRRPLQLLLLGVVLGLAISLKSLLLPFLPLYLLLVVRGSGPAAEWRRGLARAGLVVVSLALVLAPVVLYEHSRSGAWTLGGSARFNLWVGLTDLAPRSLAEDRTWEEYLEYRAGGATFNERQDALTRRLRELAQARGLPAIVAGQFPRQYLRLFDRESYFSAALPPRGSRFVAGEGFRAAPPWLARLFAAGEAGLYVAILVGAPFGLVRLVRERKPGAYAVAALLAGQLLLFWFVHVKSRYRLTLLPLLVLGVVWSLDTIHRRRRGEVPPIPTHELLLGAGGAALLLYFAFGAN